MPAVYQNKRGLKISTSISLLLISGWLFTCLSSCDIINPAEGIPAYLKVDTFSFSVVPGQGSGSARITDVWIYDEVNQVGAYEIPKTFPLLDSGVTPIILSAGIWDNGISGTRVEYPFYYPDTVSLNLEPAKTYSVTPHFTYRPSTKFFFIEDFEAGNLFTKLNGDSNIIRTNNPDETFEGNYSGLIYLDTGNTVFEGRTASSYVLSLGEPVYLEMHYLCEQSFDVGLYGTQLGASVFYYKWHINPKTTWNKIYLNMGDDVASLQADEYQILIRAVFDSTLTSSKIYLDNIKLVSFEN